MEQTVERARGRDPSISMRTGVRIVLAVLLASAAVRQWQLIAHLGFDGENSPSESESLYALRRVYAGETLYLDYSHAPYAITAYMPLIYWVTGLTVRPVSGWLPMITVARCTVYIYWIGIGVAIFGLARQAGCAWRTALVAALLWGVNQ